MSPFFEIFFLVYSFKPHLFITIISLWMQIPIINNINTSSCIIEIKILSAKVSGVNAYSNNLSNYNPNKNSITTNKN